jgi:hypothetical protein
MMSENRYIENNLKQERDERMKLEKINQDYKFKIKRYFIDILDY